MNLRARLALAVATTALALTGCGTGDGAAGEPDGSHHASSATGDTFAHIHGLGVADDVLYVATHNGLFAVDDDGQSWMASSEDHDFMGFTITDNGEFLASGHPNSRTDLPKDLGLLASADSGATWNTVSLSGEVDFHALAAKGESVYGYSSSGELLASTDRQRWSSLGQIPLADVAVNADDASTLIITTEQGPKLSTDGGKTFRVMDAAPVVAFIDWPQPNQVYGVTPDGGLYRSGDGGVTWAESGRINAPPHALTVGPDGAIYAATDTAILVSRDDGATFEPYYTWG